MSKIFEEEIQTIIRLPEDIAKRITQYMESEA